MTPQVEILPDADRLAEAAARHFIQSAQRAVLHRGAFAVALAGGSTPRAAYQQVAKMSQARGLKWERVQVFWGDERCVPPEHAHSNFRMARRSLLDRVPIPSGNVHRMRGELEPPAAAQAYARELRLAFFGSADQPAHPPRFDLILLGLGQDGHTASLFPGSPALTERLRWVVAQPAGAAGGWRLTLTLPVINAAARVLFLVAGHEKAEIARRVLHGRRDPRSVPAQAVQPVQGELIWLIDAAAASLL